MNKIINFILLLILGIAGGIFAVTIWFIGAIIVFIKEVLTSRNFREKLKELNNILKNEFKKIFGIFKK